MKQTIVVKECAQCACFLLCVCLGFPRASVEPRQKVRLFYPLGSRVFEPTQGKERRIYGNMQQEFFSGFEPVRPKIEVELTKSGMNRNLGQFFSPPVLVKKCISLRRNHGRVLEPSCGNLAFGELLDERSVFIELDEKLVRDDRVLNMDFFDYPLREKFETIIGNPPYVDNKFLNITHETGIKVEANLYLYFIEKCFHHLREGGELIFIVPRDFIKLTSARYVNTLLFEHGTITHFYDYGDEKLFSEACPNVCVFRYQKGDFSHRTQTFLGEKHLLINDGIISFSDHLNVRALGEFFDIKVGAVSGKDELFTHENGEPFVCSQTAQTGRLKRMIYDREAKELEPHKAELMSRGIKKFDETNWWSWGRCVNFREGVPRIYVNCKTRNPHPFFLNPCERWDGSVLALFPKFSFDPREIANRLNALDWRALGFVTGGRFIFAQKSLKEAMVHDKLFE